MLHHGYLMFSNFFNRKTHLYLLGILMPFQYLFRVINLVRLHIDKIKVYYSYLFIHKYIK
ncbi:hypothetical protein C2G38_556673 [Gigaspora rosea]|uniref:Uncharacterized protein n=1 Tax=Gigaspora rosea TaxID=44941 RepID=A0A397WBL7_9GLOM|nr:hypothetical protein C2G38_556673 [Gigaspora rosea]